MELVAIASLALLVVGGIGLAVKEDPEAPSATRPTRHQRVLEEIGRLESELRPDLPWTAREGIIHSPRRDGEADR